MKNSSLPFFASLAVLTSLACPSLSEGGLMHPDYPLQTYRDFAENRGIFAEDATNVKVKFSDGTVAGVIPKMMSFESLVDEGYAALTGSPQFLASVAHNGGYQACSFTKRFGGDDHYRVVKKNNGWGEETDYLYDIQMARLDKMVTEVAYVPFMEDEDQLAELEGKLVLRAGGGTQQKALTNDTAENIVGAYQYLTGGTVKFKKVIVNPPQNKDGVPASFHNAYQFQYNLTVEKDPSYPLPIGVLGGDSGSPTWAYNTKNKRWEYIGPGQSGGGGGFSQMRGSNAWCLEVLKSYDDPAITSQGKSAIVWNAPNSDGEGELKQGSQKWSYHGLPPGRKAADASLEELEATRNLVFKQTPGNLLLTDSIDMGAGTLTFHTSYQLMSESDSGHTLNCAGMDIKAKATVRSELTGQEGDEWRKIGKGTLILQGAKGDNPAKLNIGEGIVVLDRTGGLACSSAKLVSGRATLIIKQENQKDIPVEFGVRGGIWDLNGFSVTRNRISHIDTGACIGNNKANSATTLTYTGDGAYLGKFMDGKTSRLSVIYAPEKDDSKWTLQGDILIKGDITIEKGHVKITGAPTLHANQYIDPEDWRTASLRTARPLTIKQGSSFTIGNHSKVEAGIRIENNASLVLEKTGAWKGKATMEEGSILKAAPRKTVINELDIKGKITFIPIIPADQGNNNQLEIPLCRLAKDQTAQEIIPLITISPSDDSEPSEWKLSVTKNGVLFAVKEYQ